MKAFGFVRNFRDRKSVYKNFMLLVALLFVGELLFLLLADFPVGNMTQGGHQALQAVSPANPIDVSGITWGDFLPPWLAKAFGGTQISGITWGDFLPPWLAKAFGGTQISGITWGDLYPKWIQNLFA